MNSRCQIKPSRPVSLQPDLAMTTVRDGLSASEIAQAVRGRKLSALDVIEAALARIAKHDPILNSFTDVTADRARAKARAIDAAIAAGKNPGPLAGVPFAAKNLFDVQGLATRAGSKINRDLKPSQRDATLIERLEAVGAVLVGALNMGEYAYDFSGENVHDGPSRNPHDVTGMTGGSSGGSGGAVGGRLVPLALGSDTNRSIRVPSSFCGIFGLKPTYGRLSRARSFPFVFRFDHLGPCARNLSELALAYDSMQRRDVAGGMSAAPVGDGAKKFRRWYRAQMLELFKTVDVILAPATPCVAPKLGQATFVLDGVELPVRANIGIHTQPISFIGLPVVAVPVPLEPMPIGVQIIANPPRGDIAPRVGFSLERAGVGSPPPPRRFYQYT